MSRWEPNAPARLQQAAFDLYTQQGYDQTTVAEIAARAGLTERTFFRHFADKREVLFDGAERFRAAIVDPVEAAPASATKLGVSVVMVRYRQRAGLIAVCAGLVLVAVVARGGGDGDPLRHAGRTRAVNPSSGIGYTPRAGSGPLGWMM